MIERIHNSKESARIYTGFLFRDCGLTATIDGCCTLCRVTTRAERKAEGKVARMFNL